MSETRYLISEAARITQVEAHVLRYWEEELGLSIGRNKMGHRYYTDKDIRTFMNIKELKKKGLQLRAIREIISGQEEQKEKKAGELPRVIVMRPQTFQPQKEDSGKTAGAKGPETLESREEKPAQNRDGSKNRPAGDGERAAEMSLKKTPVQAKKKENREGENGTVSRNVEEAGVKGDAASAELSKKEQQFGQIMERLIRQLENGEKKEERYRRLDAAIRRHQQSRKMAAATEESGKKRKSRKKKKS